MILVSVQAEKYRRQSAVFMYTRSGIKLTVSANGAAVVLGALDGTAPTLGLAVLGRELGDLLAVDGDELGVVARGVVELVVHGDLVGRNGVGALGLHGHLGVVWTG